MSVRGREERERPQQRVRASEPAPPPASSALAMRELARVIGNQATTRMLGRMSVIDAVQAAKAAGAPDEEQAATRLAESGRRYDPIGKEWVTPAREELWDQFYALHKRSPKFALKFTDWQDKQLAKGGISDEAKKVIDVTDNTQLKALWGRDPVFDKWERARTIAKMFTDAGFAVTEPWESEKTSSKTPPVLFSIEKHKMIAMFEIHPGGGIHKAAYIRISTNLGMIKIINPASEPAYDPLQEKDVKYIPI